MALKVLIIGAGVIGAACAYRLAAAGAKVTLIEGASPGAGASGKSFGWINAAFAETEDYFALRVEALAAHHRLEAELGATSVRWGGALWWEESGAALEAQAALWTRRAYPFRHLTQAQIARLMPALKTPPEAALHLTAEGSVDGPALIARLLAAAAEKGAELRLGARAEALWAEGGAVKGAQTSHGRLAADVTLLAAGLGALPLAAGLGLTLPLEARPGLLLQSAPLPPLTDQVILMPGLHFRQGPEGHVILGESYFGAGPDAGQITEEPEALAAPLWAALGKALGQPDLPRAALWLGTRPVPKDGLPLVGPLALPGLYLAAMHSGITLAPYIGELVAADLMQGEAARLAPYRPDRFEGG